MSYIASFFGNSTKPQDPAVATSTSPSLQDYISTSHSNHSHEERPVSSEPQNGSKRTEFGVTERRALETELKDQKRRAERAAAKARDLEEELRTARSNYESIRGALYQNKDAWNQEKTLYQQEISQVRRRAEDSEIQYATLLKHFQPSEPFEPGDVLRKLNSLNSSIKDTCFTLSRAALATIPMASTFTSASGRTEILLSSLPGASLLVRSIDGAARPVDDFVELAYRYIMNEVLCRQVFSLVHPSLTPEENTFSQELYYMVRSREPQLIGAKWRSSVFLAIEQVTPRPHSVQRTSNDITQKLLNLPSAIFSTKTNPDDWFTTAMRQSVVDIVTSAYNLNAIMKASCLSLDFQPLLFHGLYPFSPETMVLHGDHEPLFAPPNHIICAVNLGLESSESFGSEKPTKYTVQVKAEVLTEGYFRDD